MLFMVIAGLLELLPGAKPAESAGTEMLCAAKYLSSAPSYVLVTVVNTNSHERWITAVDSMELKVALADEHGIESEKKKDLSYYRAIERLIDEHPDLTFEFSWGPAIERVRPHYTRSMLSEIEEALANLDNEAILAGKGNVNGLASGRGHEAVAHVLLERGLFVFRGDIVPVLFVRRTACDLYLSQKKLLGF